LQIFSQPKRAAGKKICFVRSDHRKSAADPSSNKKMASKSQKNNTMDALKEKRRKFVKAKLPKPKPNPQSDVAPIVKQSSETEELYSTLSPWYDNMERLKPIKPLDEAAKVDPKIMVQLKEKARNLYEERVKIFDRGNYFLHNLLFKYNYQGVKSDSDRISQKKFKTNV
jgi:hypothetical protein